MKHSASLCWTLAQLLLHGVNGNVLQINAKAGTFQGVQSLTGVNAWLGVRYGQAPTDQLRFLPAQAAAPAHRDDVVLADKFSPACPQNSLDLEHYKKHVSINDFEEGEDCLSLNIWTRNKTTADSNTRSAVLVWFAATGLNYGSTNIERYRGAEFVRDQEGVIVVTVNSRVGIWGFPQTQAVPLDKQNAGLSDQRLAITWLRDNIEAFGGDPARIVIMGHDFGAAAAGLYVYAYKDDPIVAGTIQAGGTEPIGTSILGPPKTEDEKTAAFSQVATKCGCPLREGDQQVARDAQLLCMQKVDWRLIKTVASERDESHHDFSPVIDGVRVFHALEYDAFAKSGNFARIPALVGSNSHAADDVVAGNQAFKDAITKIAFTCPAAKVGLYRSMFAPTWRYMYSGVWPNLNRESSIGAAQLYDLTMIFGTYNQSVAGSIDGKPVARIESTPDQIRASRMMQSAFAAFVKDPSDGLKIVGWPAYSSLSQSLVELSLDNKPDINLAYPVKYDVGCVF